MSWKILVSAGLLCALASPVLAAPTLGIDLVRNGTGQPVLDASGNWQWNVTVTPDASLFTGSPAAGSVAMELGISASVANGNLVSITKNGANFPSDNPGTPIGAGFPINTNTTAVGVQLLGNNAAVNLGSIAFGSATPQQVATIITKGPSTVGSLTTTLAWSGAYTGMGRIAQGGQNFDTFSGSITKTAKAGDANLNGTVNSTDLLALLNNINQSGRIWSQGDFNGTGQVNSSDLLILLNNINQSGTPPGAGAGSGGSVPEPSAIILAAIAAGGLAAIARRRKN
jgi:hypothetical protein